MLALVDERLFAPRVSPPKNKYDVFFSFGNQLDDAVRKPRPAAFGMGVRLVRAHGQGGVHEKDAFLRPFRQIARLRDAAADVRFQLLEDIFERGRFFNAVLYGKTQPMLPVLRCDRGPAPKAPLSRLQTAYSGSS